MIQLLFPVIFTQMGLIIIFLFKTPLRKFMILGLDRLKRGQGPIVVKTVGGTVFVVMMTSIYNAVQIRSRWNEEGDINPTDQVLMANHILEASLMGFSLFLAVIIDRLHNYIRELRLRRKSMENMKNKTRSFEDVKTGSSDEVQGLEDEKTILREKISHLEEKLELKTKDARTVESNANALKKQSEGFLMEYDRLLEENQKLRSQLESLDKRN